MNGKIIAAMLAAALAVVPAAEAFAAGGGIYVAYGADLSDEQKETVNKLMGIDESSLEADHILYVTNADEHTYLDNYLDKSVIGTRALSSVSVEEKEDGYGIQVSTANINYCTTGMYVNALATAGLKDAQVNVAGPFELSGTAALIGAVSAYNAMSGSTLDPESLETATEELVTTGELAEELGSEEAENLIGAIKGEIVAQDIEDPVLMGEVIDKAADEMGVELSEADRQKIIDLMTSIGKLDLDVNQLKNQAQSIYDKLSGMGISLDGVTKEQATGILQQILDWIKGLFASAKK